MKSFLVPLAATLLAATVCHAEGTFKCVLDTDVTYQATACADGAIMSKVSQPANAALPSDEASATAGPASPRAAMKPAAGPASPKLMRAVLPVIHSRRDELQAGMSDLQVLNNRRWGKPQHISRNRDARAWHELWNYETGANGGKQLHFINGVLAGIADLQPPPMTLAVAVASVATIN